MKKNWSEISLATRAQILLNYNNLDFFKGNFKLVDIYQENNKKNLDWFYVESEHALVKSAEKTKDGKYNFSFPIEKEQDMAKMDVKSIFGGVEKIGKIIFGCFDIENSKFYRLEKTSTFLGYDDWRDFLSEILAKEDVKYEAMITNLSSHSSHSADETKEIVNDHENTLKDIVKSLRLKTS